MSNQVCIDTRWLVGPVINSQMVQQAKYFYRVHFGGMDVFNEKGWMHIVEVHNGYLPLRIKAVLEGTVVPVRNVLFTIENTSSSALARQLGGVVSDSYDVFHAVSSIWGDELKAYVLERAEKGCLVIRPDSGDPCEVVVKVLNLLAEKLEFPVIILYHY
ncbi:nicotinate phosphoribosyltransferase (NAPRTase) family domain-containing protein [Ditylenchus destructor]|uniref:Nicotinamide phosphoribosyltransferase n=1 Tax=Ditylenchus destructor TaxID=166010 RepID=A0AAD4N3L2_9BILA|nr:nicotinate phosphoribosyltransferase (NAPRTase) family domain-containing protein [Ditylenchus destructor]